MAQYTTEHHTTMPDNNAGEDHLRYDRTALLQLRLSPLSLKRPVSLPKIPDIILDEPNGQVSSALVMPLGKEKIEQPVPICQPISDDHLFTADYKEKLPKGFKTFWKTSEYYDLIISCRGEELKVHRVLLCGLSKYFGSALKGTQQDNQLGTTLLTFDVDPKHMKQCLEYLYNGQVSVIKDDLADVAKLAKKLELRTLYVNCQKAVYKDAQVDRDNCLALLCDGQAIKDEELVKRCQAVALPLFDQLVGEDSFFNLCQKCVEDLLVHDNLAVSAEGDRLIAAMMWIEHDLENRSEHLPRLIKTLSARNTSRVVLQQTLRHALVKENEEAKSILRLALDQKPTIRSSDSSFADSAETKKLLSFVSMGWQNTGADQQDNRVLITPVSFKSRWFHLTNLPSQLQNGHQSPGSCFHKCVLYVAGLGVSHRGAWGFDVIKKSWQFHGSLRNSRINPCMIAYKDRIYVFGGHEPGQDKALVKSVEVFDTSQRVWRHAGVLLGSLCHNACCCLLGDKILVHGAIDEDKRSRIVQCYDPVTEISASLVKFISGKYQDVRGVQVVKNNIILFDDNSTYVCKLKDDVELQVRKRSSYVLPRYDQVVCLSENGKHLFAVGGSSRQEDDDDKCFVYRVGVDELINDSGTGWKSITMNWPSRDLTFSPGCHCQARLDWDDLDEVKSEF